MHSSADIQEIGAASSLEALERAFPRPEGLRTIVWYGHGAEEGRSAIDGQAPVLAAPEQQLVHQRLGVTWRCVSSPPQHLHSSQSAYLLEPP